jgi:23S rRNA pseudouridine1911/1915/1917 synthase
MGAMEPSDYIDDADPMEVVQDEQILLLELSTDLRGERMDKAIARLLPEYSRSKIQAWLEQGLIKVDDRTVIAKDIVTGAGVVRVRVPDDPQNSAFLAEDIPLQILYSDDDLAIIYKPFGMVVHPAAGNWSGTLLNALLHHFPKCHEVPRAGIVHRLDKDTSGVLVVAKTIQAQFGLVKQLQDHSMQRKYLALAWGKTPANKTIHGAIGRDPRDRVKMSLNGQHGKDATTHLQTIETKTFEGKDISLVTCVLETGRTHQIRVHLESLGHALVNDPVYKNKIPQQVSQFLRLEIQNHHMDIPGQLLHAGLLGFDHPITHQPLRFQAHPPQPFLQLLDMLGFSDASWKKEFLL